MSEIETPVLMLGVAGSGIVCCLIGAYNGYRSRKVDRRKMTEELERERRKFMFQCPENKEWYPVPLPNAKTITVTNYRYLAPCGHMHRLDKAMALHNWTVDKEGPIL